MAGIELEELYKYREQIESLKASIDKSEKDLLVHKTNLENLEEQRDNAKKECEELFCVSIKEVPKVIDNCASKLKEMMGLIENVNFNDLSLISVEELQEIRSEWDNIVKQE